MVSKRLLNIPATFITQQPPSYVLSILENEVNDNIMPIDADLEGVLIYTFDPEEEYLKRPLK